MKAYIILLSLLLVLSPALASCSKDEPELSPPAEQPEIPDNDNNSNSPMSNQLKIRIGNTTFDIITEANAAATTFKVMLPLTLNMSELNGNEKYFNLPEHLPTSPIRPGNIQAGDVMLFGSDCLVLFYQSFSTSYSYTRIGRVNNPTGLASALGSGSVSITFDIDNN